MKTKNNLFLIIIFLLSLLHNNHSQACVRVSDSDLSIAGSYQSGQQVYHGKIANYTFGNCKKYADQYFVLVSAPTYTDPLFKSISSPEGELPEEKCAIDHSPFNVSKPSEIGIENFYQSQTSFINTCLEAEVTDTRGEIDTEKQINCEIIQVSANTVVAKGPRCAFKIHDNSNFNVHYRMNPSCLNLNFLKEKGNIRPMDSKASLAIYKTADLIPGSPNYDILSIVNARITLQPDKDLLPVSQYSGTPGSNWPMQYGAQIEFGKILLSRTLRLHNTPYVYLKTPFLVNNNCPEVCKNGFCTSACDFYAPVAARMTLKKKTAEESAFHAIDFWYQGNLVPSRFLGELSFGRPLPDEPINVGDKFLLIAEFSNPALTYKTIIDEAKQLLIKLSPINIPTGSAGRPGGLDGLGILEGTNIIPENAGLPVLGNIKEEQNKTDVFLNVLNSLVGNDESWPPYYTSVINGELSDNANRIYLTLKVGFRVASISSSGAVSVDLIQYSKESKIFGSNTTNVTIPPQIKCSSN
jgi:hypothetical protein